MNRGDPSTQVQVDARLLWRAVLADLQQTVPPAAFEWLRTTRLSDFDADVATVEVGDRVTAETLHRRFARDVERSLSERVGRPVTASFKAAGARSWAQPKVRVSHVCRRIREPIYACGVGLGGGTPRGKVQPAFHLWRRGSWQDASAARHWPPGA